MHDGVELWDKAGGERLEDHDTQCVQDEHRRILVVQQWRRCACGKFDGCHFRLEVELSHPST